MENNSTLITKVNTIKSICNNIEDSLRIDDKKSNARYKKTILILTEKIDNILNVLNK